VASKTLTVRLRRLAGVVTAVIGALSISPAVGAATTATFDLEELPLIHDCNSSEVGVPIPSTQSGLTATFTREGGGDLAVISLPGNPPPAAFGSRTLCPSPLGELPEGVIADFSAPVDAVSVDFGNQDFSDAVGYLEAYSGPGGSGTLLDSDSRLLHDGTFGSSFTIETFTVVASGIRSVRFNTGDFDHPNRFVFDNIVAGFDTAPPPAHGLCLGQPATGTTGTDGNDVILTGNGPDTVDGGRGDDLICTQGGDDFVRGGLGNDMIHSGTGDDNAGGGAGADQVQGGSGNDVVQGGGGDDTVRGSEGNDSVNGGDGADQVFGGADDDALTGNTGAPDACNGGAGNDHLAANSGCETVTQVP
jgi:Ca2+-binding RTX toxin-like protein